MASRVMHPHMERYLRIDKQGKAFLVVLPAGTAKNQ
jgi:hypothetical protein